MAQRSVNQNIVLNTTAGSGDIVVKDRHLFIQGANFFKFDDVQYGSIVKETAITSETAGVVTVTIGATPAASTKYSFQIVVQPLLTAQGVAAAPIVLNFAVTSAASGQTTTTIADQFKSQYGLVAGYPYFTTNALASGATIVFTAAAGYPIITGTLGVDGSTTASTVVQTTQGIAKRGTPAAMQALGVPSALTTDTAYTLYSCLVATNIGESNTARVNQFVPKMLWIGENVANKSSFISRFDQAILAYTSTSGTTIDHSVIDVGE